MNISKPRFHCRVLGCVVNGPGEARETDIGLTGGGNGKHMVYLSGVTDHTIESDDMLDHIVELLRRKPPKSKRVKPPPLTRTPDDAVPAE